MNLITDRQASDLSLLDTLRKKIIARTATEAEWAQWNADLKAAYNASDLNRVIAAVEYLVDRLTSLGYQVDYTPIQFVRDVTLEPDSVVSGDEYDTYTYTAPGYGTYICSVPSGQEETISVSGGTIEVDLRIEQIVNYDKLFGDGDFGEHTATYKYRAYGSAYYSGISYSATESGIYVTGKITGEHGYQIDQPIDAAQYSLMTIDLLSISSSATCRIALYPQITNGYGSSTCYFYTYAGVDYTKYTASSETVGKVLFDIGSLTDANLYPTVGKISGNMNAVRSMTVDNWYLFKPDDWPKLCNVAGITAPATLAELISNEASISSILNSEKAVNFMVLTCTGDFMAYATNSTVFMAALESSPYKTLVQGNEHWAKFLAMVA